MTRSQFFFGCSFIALGTVLLLDRAGTLDAGVVFSEWWPTLVILAAIAQVATRPRNVVGGAIVGTVGLALLLWTLWGLDTIALFWPLVLIGLGLWLLIRPGSRSEPLGGDGDVVTLFDDRSVRMPAGPLPGESITTIFGDVALDLRETTIDDRVTMPIVTIFGDVRLHIPPNWSLTVSGPEIFGDVKVRRDTEPGPHAPVLHLQVVTIFGDITVLAGVADRWHESVR